MRLLICTQAVDRTDPVLGFFHAWIEALAARFDSVEVICLKEGSHNLPQNIRVYSLGKERGRVSRVRYAIRFLRLVWVRREQYDTVFVHMNQEYVLLAGLLWRLSGKRVVLWRNHKMGSVLTWVACKLAHTVCYTSPSAYVAQYRNAVRMPIGIDTNVFSPAASPALRGTVLFLGRLDAVKKPEVFLDAIKQLEKEGVVVQAHVYGDPTPGREAYAKGLKEHYSSLNSVTFLPGVTHDKTPLLYQTHSLYVNATPSGSFDKTIGEAMAAGCIVIAMNEVLRGVLRDQLLVHSGEASAVAVSIQYALSLTDIERRELSAQARAYVERTHSLALLTKKLFGILTS